MSFFKPKMPAAPVAPPPPSAAEQERKRAAAAEQAETETARARRASDTMSAGRALAYDEQEENVLKRDKRRAAVTTLGAY